MLADWSCLILTQWWICSSGCRIRARRCIPSSRVIFVRTPLCIRWGWRQTLCQRRLFLHSCHRDHCRVSVGLGCFPSTTWSVCRKESTSRMVRSRAHRVVSVFLISCFFLSGFVRDEVGYTRCDLLRRRFHRREQGMSFMNRYFSCALLVYSESICHCFESLSVSARPLLREMCHIIGCAFEIVCFVVRPCVLPFLCQCLLDYPSMSAASADVRMRWRLGRISASCRTALSNHLAL